MPFIYVLSLSLSLSLSLCSQMKHVSLSSTSDVRCHEGYPAPAEPEINEETTTEMHFLSFSRTTYFYSLGQIVLAEKVEYFNKINNKISVMWLFLECYIAGDILNSMKFNPKLEPQFWSVNL